MVKNLGKEAIGRKPCPYEGCGSHKVWFWGWYKRKGGAIPLGIEEEVADAIPLRRFQCQACGRCFSSRPPFLVFARRYAAVTYQRALKSIALRLKLHKTSDWDELSPSGLKAFRQALCEAELGNRLMGWTVKEWPKLWFWIRRQAQNTIDEQPRLAIHILCLGLARHRDGTRYSLSAL